MKYSLQLFVTGRTQSSRRAIDTLQTLCDERLKDEHEIEIIDVLEFPQMAEQAKIMATPTLIKRLPTPSRRIIGDLSNHEKLLMGLDLPEIKEKIGALS